MMSVLIPLTLWSVLTSSLVLCSYGSDPRRQDWAESLLDTDGTAALGRMADWRPQETGYAEEDGLAPSAPHALSLGEEGPRGKREGHSLSIVNPLDVLRQRLMLEMARRRMKVNQEQIRENELLLKNLGKRADRTTAFRRPQVSDLEDFEV